jgi:hypothetical protein
MHTKSWFLVSSSYRCARLTKAHIEGGLDRIVSGSTTAYDTSAYPH